jgi:two-component system sensor histidine kinase YesM
VRAISKSRTSIRQKIFFSSLLLIITALLLSATIYIVFFAGTSRRLVQQLAREINKQIVFNYEQYLGSVVETGNFLQDAIISLDIAEDREQIIELFVRNSEIKRDLVTKVIFDASGEVILSDSPGIQSGELSRRALGRAAANPELNHFFIGPSINRRVSRNSEVLIVARSLDFFREDAADGGILYLEFDSSAITTLSRNTNLGDAGHLLILDDGNNLMYQSVNDRYSAESYRIAAERFIGGFPVRLLDQNMYVNINTLANTRWRLVTINNIDEVTQTPLQISAVVLVVFIISLLLTALAAGLVSFRISRPINLLINYMERVEEGEFFETISVEGQKEIVALADSFNHMITRIRGLMTRLVEQQRDKRKTELRALQNQINPHFLYNTLDSIVWLAEHKREQDVITTVVALAKFFRISISRGANFIPVETELEHALNYLTIQQIRYVERFSHRFEIDPEMMRYRVMKLILQPLLENAIHHGLGDEPGDIVLRGWLGESMMYFSVSNSGYGITEAKIREIDEKMRGKEDGHGVGLRNVFQRLRLYYGEEADIRISSIPDEETTVTLEIPLRPEDRPGSEVDE